LDSYPLVNKTDIAIVNEQSKNITINKN